MENRTNYSFEIDGLNVKAIVIDHPAASIYTSFVELELAINNRRICRLYLAEVPSELKVRRYAELICNWDLRNPNFPLF